MKGMLRDWDKLPKFMRTPEVRPYWEHLNKKRHQLVLKRMFDRRDRSPLSEPSCDKSRTGNSERSGNKH